MTIKEIRELTTDELRERLENDTRAYIEKKINHAVSPLDKPSDLKEDRRTIARIQTVLAERENSNDNQ